MQMAAMPQDRSMTTYVPASYPAVPSSALRHRVASLEIVTARDDTVSQTRFRRSDLLFCQGSGTLHITELALWLD